MTKLVSTSRLKQCWEVLCHSTFGRLLSGWDFQDCSSGVPAYDPRTQTDIINLWANFKPGFMLMLFVLYNFECCQAWGLVGQPPYRDLTIPRFIPHFIYVAASLALTAGSHSQSGRLEGSSEACFALSLKPKQDYLLNFPNMGVSNKCFKKLCRRFSCSHCLTATTLE